MKTIRIIAALMLAATLAFGVKAQDKTVLPAMPSGITSQVIAHDGYTVSYNDENCTPNWVVWVLDKERASQTAVSRDGEEFLPDPEAAGTVTDTRDYSRSGYDRGHMCPAADNKGSEKLMKESFYLSNVCPQDRVLNSGLWEEVEARCRYEAKHYGYRLTIVCGPVNDRNGKRIGAHRILVPKAFFKVIFTTNVNGKPEAIAFLFPNEPENPAYDVFNYAMSVDDLERATGYDFFAGMPEESQAEFEGKYHRAFWDNVRWRK